MYYLMDTRHDESKRQEPNAAPCNLSYSLCVSYRVISIGRRIETVMLLNTVLPTNTGAVLNFDDLKVKNHGLNHVNSSSQRIYLSYH